MSWINHLPPACWSTFWKSNFKQQLGCRFDIMDNESYFFVFWHMQLYMSSYIRSFFGFTFLNILYFFKYSCTNIFHRRSLYTFYFMVTSLNGNIFHITGPLCGEFTGPRWIPRTKASDAELWCFLLSVPWINGWVNNGDAGDLRRTHYDVIIMDSQKLDSNDDHVLNTWLGGKEFFLFFFFEKS